MLGHAWIVVHKSKTDREIREVVFSSPQASKSKCNISILRRAVAAPRSDVFLDSIWIKETQSMGTTQQVKDHDGLFEMHDDLDRNFRRSLGQHYMWLRADTSPRLRQTASMFGTTYERAY